MQSTEPLFRAALNVWASRKKWAINYDSRISFDAGNEYSTSISIRSLSFVSYATASSKKQAANKAAFDYLKFLFINKYLDEEELSNSCYYSFNVKDSVIEGARAHVEEGLVFEGPPSMAEVPPAVNAPPQNMQYPPQAQQQPAQYAQQPAYQQPGQTPYYQPAQPQPGQPPAPYYQPAQPQPGQPPAPYHQPAQTQPGQPPVPYHQPGQPQPGQSPGPYHQPAQPQPGQTPAPNHQPAQPQSYPPHQAGPPSQSQYGQPPPPPQQQSYPPHQAAPQQQQYQHHPPSPQHYGQHGPPPQHYQHHPPSPQHYSQPPPPPQHYGQPPPPQQYGQYGPPPPQYREYGPPPSNQYGPGPDRGYRDPYYDDYRGGGGYGAPPMPPRYDDRFDDRNYDDYPRDGPGGRFGPPPGPPPPPERSPRGPKGGPIGTPAKNNKSNCNKRHVEVDDMDYLDDMDEYVPAEYRPMSKEFFYPQAPPTLYGNWCRTYEQSRRDSVVSKRSRQKINKNGNANGEVYKHEVETPSKFGPPPPSNQNNNNSHASYGGDDLLDMNSDNFLESMLQVGNIKNSIAKSKANTNSETWGEEIQESVGGFTLENAKHLLGNFMLANRVDRTDYVYKEDGPPHKKIFTASLKFITMGREIDECAKAKTKADASRLCAYKILCQLFKENLIEAFTTMISKRSLMKMNYIYAVDVSPKLRNLMILNHKIVKAYQVQNNFAYTPGVLSIPNPLQQQAIESEGHPSYLYWCAPMENFDPWTGKRPTDPMFADKSFGEINAHLHETFTATLKNPKFQDILSERRKLPIFAIKERVMSLIQNNSVLLIKGSTGCGKTTQVPQFILDTYLKNQNGANCNIIVTQPRRISAISLSERVAAERLEKFGTGNGKSSVGYSVRFDHQYPRPYGSIMYCTTGHLLRRLNNGLRGISHIIIDEVHERDISTDCLLVLVRDLVRMGLGIKVVVMSATVGVQAFQAYLDNCHVLEIEGNLFPVEKYFLEDIIEIMKWKPSKLSYVEDAEVSDLKDFGLDEDGQGQGNIFNAQEAKNIYSKNTLELMNVMKEGVVCYELIASILEYIYHMDQNGHGAVLIFLPGWQAIFSLYYFLKRHPIFCDERKFWLLPLHSRLSSKENSRVFEKTFLRKIILSTNIAETSITIDDVVFVIDSCLMKRKVYDSRVNVTNYIVDWVSRSNIEQRKGRAGRIRSGYFFALCSKKRYDNFEGYKVPEILSSSLVETCLLVKYFGFTNVEEFMSKLLDPPPTGAVQQALSVLQGINAFDSKNYLTPLGKILIKLPMDPRLGKMIIQAILMEVGSPAITIASATALSNELFDFTDLAQVGFELMKLDERNFSDHWIAFKVFEEFDQGRMVHKDASRLNNNAMYQLRNARNQLVETLKNAGFPPNLFVSKPRYEKIEIDVCLSLLLTAFYPNVCAFAEGRRVITNEKKIGLIQKNSVIYSYIWDRVLDKLQTVPSPLFVYTEKSKFENIISCKQLTMITFLQFMLFGAQKYEYPVTSDNTIILDGWLEVKIDHEVFDTIWIVRNEFERILTNVCQNPELLARDMHFELTIYNTIRYMCSSEEVKFHLENRDNVINNGQTPTSGGIPKPPPPPPPTSGVPSPPKPV